MTARLAPSLFTALSAAALLGACATAQENPNYQFSSKYDPNGTVVQLAGYDEVQPSQSMPAVFESAPVPSEVVTYTVDSPAPVQTAVSETEQAFDASTMDGTPGYALFNDAAPSMMAETPAPAPAPMPAQPGNSRAVSYDYSQNVIVAGADTPITATEVRPYGLSGAAYTVQPGDTVYSLARKRCVALTDITAMNAIGADYAISIGQQLQLPASRC